MEGGIDQFCGAGRKFGGSVITLMGFSLDTGTGTWVGWHCWDVGTGGTYCLNGITYNLNHDDGDSLSWNVWMESGTYTSVVVGYKDTNLGILKIDIDSSTVATHDQYAAALDKYARWTTTGIVVPPPGKKRVITVKVDGKNDNSSNHYIVFSYVGFWRTA